MKESTLFVKFIKENLVIFILLMLMSLLVSMLYIRTLNFVDVSSILLEFSYNEQNVNYKIIEADEAVLKIRSLNLQKELKLSDQCLLEVYKPGPVSIKINLSCPNLNTTALEIGIVKNYLIQNYDLKEVGEVTTWEETPNYFQYVGLSLIIALGIGLFISLIRSYFKNY